MSNAHAKHAESWLRNASGQNDARATLAVARAQVHASLATAHELHTANLIAAQSFNYRAASDEGDLYDEGPQARAQQIANLVRERLDLPPQEEEQA